MGASYYSTGGSLYSGSVGSRVPGPSLSVMSSPSQLGNHFHTTANTAGSSTWIAANRALYVPVVLDYPFTVKQMWLYNGTAVAGNVDIGVYSSTGTRLVSSGATAQSGTSVPQVFDVSDTALAPGSYYWAVVLTDATTATVFRAPMSALLLGASGVFQEATSGSLPATASFSTPANSFMPIFGATQMTVF